EIISPEEIIKARDIVSKVYMDDKIKDYIVDIVIATRDPERYGLKLKELIEYGASPRATINLALASKAYAFIKRRGYVTPADVKSVGMDVLRHRIIVTYEAEAEEISSEDIVKKIFDTIEVP
ncbi:MAG TPA: MoxR family ATPase, partial [Candidatus Eremiobacteraeota bacterium]|nr:MoxR family ATPase [Candidatus Eremiobacteraeota bacterium]